MAEGDSELQDLYRDVLIDYFRDGSYKGALPDADVREKGVNPVCGDEIEVSLQEAGGRLRSVRHGGRGCVISQASSAMMCEALEGKPVEEARRLIRSFKDMMLSGASPDGLPEELEECRAFEGVRRFPVRIKCALLAWNTMLQALDKVRSREAA